MNGNIFNKIVAPLEIITTVCCGMLASIGVSFFSVLCSSGLLLRVPDGVVTSKGHVFSDYYRLVTYLCGFSSKRFKFRYVPISSSASQHFADVRDLIRCGMLIMLIDIIIFVILLRILKKRNQLWELVPLYREGMVLFIVIATLIAVSFQDSFLWFHYHFFNNHKWVFNPQTDPIILVLSDHFFLNFFILWIGLSIVLMFLLYFVIKRSVNFFI